ncbi:hypothetical protein CR513_14137, partial [Mucuna pruriens]
MTSLLEKRVTWLKYYIKLSFLFNINEEIEDDLEHTLRLLSLAKQEIKEIQPHKELIEDTLALKRIPNHIKCFASLLETSFDIRRREVLIARKNRKVKRDMEENHKEHHNYDEDPPKITLQDYFILAFGVTNNIHYPPVVVNNYELKLVLIKMVQNSSQFKDQEPTPHPYKKVLALC